MIMKTKVAAMTIIVEDPVPVYARYPHANAIITPAGRAGANVVMLNLSPQSLRNKYGPHDVAETTHGVNS